MKENVILGRLIPAGTGFNVFNNMDYDLGEGVIDPAVMRKAADEAARAAMEREITEAEKNKKSADLVAEEKIPEAA